MLLTMFLTGYGVLNRIMTADSYRIRYGSSYLICGLVCVTVYAEVFSLFHGVGFWANLLLCALCLIIFWRHRIPLVRMLAGQRENWIKGTSRERGRMAAVLILFFLFAYGTSRGLLHYDTALYHAQSIRWIEEYGVVKGLGNLHCRLAYNSSSFALSALYSMAFLGKGSYHCAAGFTAFLLVCECLEIFPALRRRQLRTSDYARLMAVYYLVNIFDEMISPASDYFMVLLAFYLIIRWLDLLERQIADILPYALLCVLGVFLLTVKLSAGLILLLVLRPARRLVRERKWGQMILYLCLGLLTALPYFVRNVLLSGWLVYPFTAVDLFDVPWKIPKGMADYDAHEIQVWGRGIHDVSRYGEGIGSWFADWFHALAASDRFFVLLALLSSAVLAVYALFMAAGLQKRRGDLLLVQVTLAASFLFWLFTSPLIRYGCVYVYLTAAVIPGGILSQYTSQEGRLRRVIGGFVTAAAAVLLIGKAAALGKLIVTGETDGYLIRQKDYENYVVNAYELEGVTFYYPVEGDQVGYDSFPSSPGKAQIRFLGEGIEEGFMSGDSVSEAGKR